MVPYYTSTGVLQTSVVGPFGVLIGENGQHGSGLARGLMPAPRGRNQASVPDDDANGQLTFSGYGGNHMIFALSISIETMDALGIQLSSCFIA